MRGDRDSLDSISIVLKFSSLRKTILIILALLTIHWDINHYIYSSDQSEQEHNKIIWSARESKK